MKLTKQRLKEIIKEELEEAVAQAPQVYQPKPSREKIETTRRIAAAQRQKDIEDRAAKRKLHHKRKVPYESAEFKRGLGTTRHADDPSDPLGDLRRSKELEEAEDTQLRRRRQTTGYDIQSSKTNPRRSSADSRTAAHRARRRHDKKTLAKEPPEELDETDDPYGIKSGGTLRHRAAMNPGGPGPDIAGATHDPNAPPEEQTIHQDSELSQQLSAYMRRKKNK
jgi:hypothetical protein